MSLSLYRDKGECRPHIPVQCRHRAQRVSLSFEAQRASLTFEPCFDVVRDLSCPRGCVVSMVDCAGETLQEGRGGQGSGEKSEW